MLHQVLQHIKGLFQTRYIAARLLAPALVGLWFVYSFFEITDYQQVVFGAGNWQQFSLEFPFVLLATLFVGHVGSTASVVVYIFSALAYSYMCYKAVRWAEMRYLRFKQRPSLALKKVRAAASLVRQDV